MNTDCAYFYPLRIQEPDTLVGGRCLFIRPNKSNLARRMGQYLFGIAIENLYEIVNILMLE